MAAMLGLFGNLSMSEALVVVVLAVLIFGRRLPEVAVQAMRGFHRLRRSLEDLRRETGVDAELREMRRTLREVEREAHVEDPLRMPSEPRRERARGFLPRETPPLPAPQEPRAEPAASSVVLPPEPPPQASGG